MGEQEHGFQSQLRALQRTIGEASSSLRASCATLAQNATQLAAEVHRQTAPLHPRGAPFAAINLPFARASSGGGDGQKKKKKRIPKPGERLQELESQERDEVEVQRAEQKAERRQKAKKEKVKKEKPKEKEKEVAALRDGDDKDTPEIVRKLNEVEEPEGQAGAESAAQELRRIRAGLSPEQRRQFDGEIWDRLGRQIKVEVDGETMSLRRLAKEAAHDKAVKDIGGDEPAIRHELRSDVQSRIPGWQLRPDAPKMELRADEEAALDLDRLGDGHLFSPRKYIGYRYGVLHDFAWGMFGRIRQAREILEEKWAGRDPDEVLAQQDFYDDILANANKIELTLMMTAERPIPLKQLREKFLEQQCRVLTADSDDVDGQQLPELDDAHKLILSRIKREATVESLSSSGLIDKKGNIVPDTKLIVTVGPRWQLTAEAISSGKLREQQTVYLGHWQNKAFAKGVMKNFLGLPSIDPIGKTRVGNGVLYVTNGFNFENPEVCGNPNQFYDPDDSNETKPWSSIVFSGEPDPSQTGTVAEKLPSTPGGHGPSSE